MGVPTRSSQAGYRDDPDAVSLHTTPDDYTYQDAPQVLPPSYADSESAGSSAATHALHHQTSSRYVPPPVRLTRRLDHDGYEMSGNKPKVFETLDVMDPRYDTDPEYLEASIQDYAKAPPNPLIYIMGTHTETTTRNNKKETKDVKDFRIVINLQNYLWRGAWEGEEATPMRLSTATNGEKTYRGSFMKKRAPGFKQDIEVGGTEAPSLREWCHRYCASASKLRIFRLRRQVLGLDETYLKARIEGLIRSAGYRGTINIQFPVEEKNVDIYTSHRVNEWRLKRWVCWIFYLTFLWIFTWPILFFATKRYAVVKAEWLFSSLAEDGSKKYASISEEQWFERWHVGIRRLVLERYQGEAAYERLQGVIDRPADPPMPGSGINLGSVNTNNPVGLLQQGFGFASALSRGNNLADSLQAGLGGQGGWGYDN